MKKLSLAVAAALVVCTLAWHSVAQAQEAALAPVPYPKGWRDWKHVKSMAIVNEKHPLYAAFGGIHHIYINNTGFAALKAKKSNFPTGTTIVFDLLEHTDSGGAMTEGKRKFTAVMVRDTAKYASTEGWGWQVFAEGDPNKPQIKDVSAARACATCHKEVETKQFVFMEYRE
jgi:hypothetical protein